MKEDVNFLDLTEEDFQTLLKDIKKRREKYRKSLDEENEIKKLKEGIVAETTFEELIRSRGVNNMFIYQKDYDDILKQYLRDDIEEADGGIYLTSDYVEPVITLDTIKSCDCTTDALNTIHIVNKYNTNISELMKKNLTKGEIFIDEDTQEVYIVDKGDLETYWLKIGREEAYKKEIERLERNPWLDEDFDFS